MKKFIYILAASVAAVSLLASCSKDDGSDSEKEDEKPLVSDPYFQIKQDKKKLVDCGQVVTFTISTNIDISDWDCVTSPEGLVQVSKDSTQLQLAVSDDLDMTEDRTINVEFKCPRYSGIGASSTVTIKKGLLVDLEFSQDGTATDVSGSSIPVKTYPGVNLVTYNNAEAGGYVARFFSGLGTAVTDGYYKVDYSTNSILKNALADGHSFEVQFMLATENNSDGEVKMFSAMQGGGTGVMLTAPSRGRDIAFLPNVSTTGTSNWCFAQSGIVPQVGKYYHVVGVWNKDEGKAYVYVNGELKGTANAKGSMVFPSSALAQWICVGGDATTSGAEAAWNGDVVIARVYDAALSAAAVKKLWEKANKDFKDLDIKISDVLYISDGKVNAGTNMTICGEGFQSGDQIILQSFDGKTNYACTTTFGTGKVIYTIPSDFQTGNYKIYVKRGSSEAPLGTASFTVTTTPVTWKAPKVVAHRGAWTGDSCPQNSIAALKRAQELGCYGSEMDLWITTDNVLYVNHDGIISGKSIQNSTSAEMETVKLSNGEKIPTFQEYLTQLKASTKTKMIIEIKDHTQQEREYLCTDEAVRLVKENGLQSQVEWIAFDFNTCKRIIADDPTAIVGYLTSTSDLQSVYNAGIRGADFSYDYMFSNKDLFDKAHDMGMFIDIWTVDTDSDLMRCISLGADLITTNKADRLIEIIGRIFE